MSIKRIIRPVAAGAVLFFALAAAPVQGDASLGALQQVERGRWELKDLDRSVRTLCIRRTTDLLYVSHGGARCSPTTQRGDRRSAVVSYACAGHGQGRTSVTVETPRLVRIETSGIRDGAPFSNEFEARKVGECR
jgi:hypothetical protein